jgi:hypothetical protein
LHGNSKLLERVIVGLVAGAISVDVLATELPRLMPYIAMLALIYIIIRLVVYHTNGW